MGKKLDIPRKTLCQSPKLQRGDYVLGTVDSYGNVLDPWRIGFLIAKYPDGKFCLVDADGIVQGRHAYARVERITAKEGAYLLEITTGPARVTMWELLEQYRESQKSKKRWAKK